MLYLLHQTITRAADRDPSRDALRCRGEALTYEELEVRSNALANSLVRGGVRRGDRVAIYAKKSVELGLAVYGITKAGAAYVPLDPTAPPARLAHILTDCGIRHVVSREESRRPLLRILERETPVDVCIGLAPGDDDPATFLSWDEALAAGDEAPDVRTLEDDLAYILYTSGSTGTPKGIMHTHRSALAFAEVAAKAYGFRAEDRLTNHAPLHFDISTMDYFSGAVAGATTVIVPEEAAMLPASLSELLEKERITVFYAVPLAMIQLLLNGAIEKRDLSALRWLIFGGEPFPVKHLRALMSKLPQASFSNIYGPTEVNGCTYHVVEPIPENSEEPIPIGKLFDNAEALVVDGDDQPVPPGGRGELLIRSGTRMKGYWGRPEMTDAATFRRVPFEGVDHLFHRTGDLVEERSDGSFDFIGRKDRQIKTRGHRVELDEVEAAILTHDLVEEAAAFAVPDGEGSQRIEAAVRLVEGESERPRDLEKHVRKLLPPYALPVRTHVLDTFPRTTTGKIDRNKLRERSADLSDAS